MKKKTKKKSSIMKRKAVKGQTYHKGDLELDVGLKKIIDKLDEGHGVLCMGEGNFIPWASPDEAEADAREQELEGYDEPNYDKLRQASLFKRVKEYQESPEGIKAEIKRQESASDPEEEARIAQKEFYQEELDKWNEQQGEQQSKDLKKIAKKKEVDDDKLRKSGKIKARDVKEAAEQRSFRLPKPPSYKSKDPMEELVRKFTIVADDISWNNRVPAILMLHAIIGSLLRKFRFMKGALLIDPRIHFMWIQSSGSGKTSLRTLFKDLCKDLGLAYKNVSEFTDAALIGTAEPKSPAEIKAEENEEIKRRKQMFNPPTTIIEIPKSKAVYGFLKTTEVIYMDDANDFIADENISKHNMKARKHFRDTMNPIGNNDVGKDLRNHIDIEFFPEATLVATTYWFSGRIARQDLSGFFQRFMLFVRSLTTEDRRENRKIEIKRNKDNAADPTGIMKKREVAYQDLLKEFLKISFSKPEILVFNDESLDYIDEIDESMGDYLEVLGETKRFATEFQDRTRNYIYVFAVHSSILNNRLKVTKKDVEYSARIVVPLFKEAITWFEGVGKEGQTIEEIAEKVATKIFTKVYEELAKKGNVLKSDLFEKVRKEGKKSNNTVRYIWYPLIQDLFKEERKQIGNTRKVYIEMKK